MKTLSMWYQPIAEVELSRAEVESLALYSERHYDAKCRSLSKQGGIVYGMRNMFDSKGRGAAIRYRLVAHDADLLTKVAECDPALSAKLLEITKALNAEWRKANAGNLR